MGGQVPQSKDCKIVSFDMRLLWQQTSLQKQASKVHNRMEGQVPQTKSACKLPFELRLLLCLNMDCKKTALVCQQEPL